MKGVVASAEVNTIGLSVSIEWLWTLNVNPSEDLKRIVPRQLPFCKSGRWFHELGTRRQNQVPSEAVS
jgi:hypothetical protein